MNCFLCNQPERAFNFFTGKKEIVKPPPGTRNKRKGRRIMPEKKRNEFGLTELQERFCQEYLKDLNGTRAYIRAGYSAKPDVARVAAYRLLAKPEIQERIQQLMSERSNRTQIEADSVLREIARIAFVDIVDIVDWPRNGNLIIKDPGELTPEQTRAFKKIKKTKLLPAEAGRFWAAFRSTG